MSEPSNEIVQIRPSQIVDRNKWITTEEDRKAWVGLTEAEKIGYVMGTMKVAQTILSPKQLEDGDKDGANDPDRQNPVNPATLATAGHWQTSTVSPSVSAIGPVDLNSKEAQERLAGRDAFLKQASEDLAGNKKMEIAAGFQVNPDELPVSEHRTELYAEYLEPILKAQEDYERVLKSVRLGGPNLVALLADADKAKTRPEAEGLASPDPAPTQPALENPSGQAQILSPRSPRNQYSAEATGESGETGSSQSGR